MFLRRAGLRAASSWRKAFGWHLGGLVPMELYGIRRVVAPGVVGGGEGGGAWSDGGRWPGGSAVAWRPGQGWRLVWDLSVMGGVGGCSNGGCVLAPVPLLVRTMGGPAHLGLCPGGEAEDPSNPLHTPSPVAIPSHTRGVPAVIALFRPAPLIHFLWVDKRS